MTKMQFQAAAVRAQEEIEAEQGEDAPQPKVLEFSIGGEDFVCDVPTLTQVILLSTASDGATMRGMIQGCLDFLEGILHDDGIRRIKKLMAKGVITNELLLGGDENNEEGIISWIVEQVSEARPTEPSVDSSPSPKTTGQRSTGRAPGKGSIPSASQSAAS